MLFHAVIIDDTMPGEGYYEIDFELKVYIKRTM